jgi:hypothetical protein
MIDNVAKRWAIRLVDRWIDRTLVARQKIAQVTLLEREERTERVAVMKVVAIVLKSVAAEEKKVGAFAHLFGGGTMSQSWCEICCVTGPLVKTTVNMQSATGLCVTSDLKLVRAREARKCNHQLVECATGKFKRPMNVLGLFNDTSVLARCCFCPSCNVKMSIWKHSVTRLFATLQLWCWENV